MATAAAAKNAVRKARVKTHKNGASVADFIAAVESDQKRADLNTIDKMLRDISGEEPRHVGLVDDRLRHVQIHEHDGRGGLAEDWLLAA